MFSSCSLNTVPSSPATSSAILCSCYSVPKNCVGLTFFPRSFDAILYHPFPIFVPRTSCMPPPVYLLLYHSLPLLLQLMICHSYCAHSFPLLLRKTTCNLMFHSSSTLINVLTNDRQPSTAHPTTPSTPVTYSSIPAAPTPSSSFYRGPLAITSSTPVPPTPSFYSH